MPRGFDSTIVSNRPDDKLVYRRFIEYFGPFLWVENSIGLGCRVDITSKCFLKQKIGLGVHYLFGEDDRILGPNPVREFYGFVNIGIGIKIDTKTP